MEIKQLTESDLPRLPGEPVVINQSLHAFRKDWAVDIWTDKNENDWTSADLHKEFAPLFLVEDTSKDGIESLRIAMYGDDGCDGQDCEGSKFESDAIFDSLHGIGMFVRAS